jgi:hypothetical protein
MLSPLRYLLSRLTGSQETRLIDNLFTQTALRKKKKPNSAAEAVSKLEKHFLSDRFSVFLGVGRNHVSRGGGVSICLDIFGPEVRLVPRVRFRPALGLLDCEPSNYGLEYSEAKRLYEAILSKIYGKTESA